MYAKTPVVLSTFYTKSHHFYQDRLGTNIGRKALKTKRVRFLIHQVLSQAQIADEQRHDHCTPLLAFWGFNGRSGDTVVDSGPRGDLSIDITVCANAPFVSKSLYASGGKT